MRLLLLLVEEDHDIRISLAELLSDAGYSVCAVADGVRALDKLRSLHPDLVLLDHRLPGPTSSDEVLRAKAIDSEISGIPVIVLTTEPLPPEMDGVVAVLSKPFDFDHLIALIERVVGPPQKPDATAAA
jgi:CheY-like chemotaxis protein